MPVWVAVTATITVSILGGITRMFGEKGPDEKLDGGDVAKYVSASLLAGILFAALFYRFYGLDWLLVFAAGSSGYCSVQALALVTLVFDRFGKWIRNKLG